MEGLDIAFNYKRPMVRRAATATGESLLRPLRVLQRHRGRRVGYTVTCPKTPQRMKKAKAPKYFDLYPRKKRRR
jgi:hypothetical protein